MPKLWRRHKVQEAEQALARSYLEGREVDRLSRAMGARRRRNNFAPMIEEAFRGVRREP